MAAVCGRGCLGWGGVARSPEKRDSGPDSPDAGASTADWAVRPAGRRAAGRGDVLTWGVSNVLKRPDFSRFLSWRVEVRGATGERGPRIDTWCHGWGKKKAPPKRGFQPRCPLSCELGLLHPGQPTPLGEVCQDRL